ncbi:DUF4232 domain-containing protein [Streptomyces sp. NBC_00859]|uniref:DUF4232 domain-containing protein n=1 Tax=Streptomyces sp. NBC_00859 TaxID=2903682 RepID=UPI0038696CFC|nr:DUF4232 domain-containing protein [Streptomyces sp. NBC_00859]
MQIRRTRRALTFLAVAGATVLATAACGTNGSSSDGSPNRSEGAGSSVSGSPASGSSAAKGTDASASDDSKAGSSAQGPDSAGSAGTSGSSGISGSKSGGSGPASGKSGSGSSAADATCSAGAMKIALISTGGTLPAVVLKATNASGSSCDLYGFPTVGYPGAQAAVGANERSKPQAVVTLAPGRSGYAAIALPDGAGKHREKTLTVGLLGRDMGPVNGQATVTASGSGIALTDSSTVSYWQSDEAAALQ